MIYLNKKKIYLFYLRVFISLLIFFIVNYLYSNNIFNDEMHKVLFNSNIDFSYFRSKTNKLLKNILGKREVYVTSEKLEYKKIEPYNSSYKLITDYNYIIKNSHPGVVVFIGNKENLGSTIILELDNGINIWYSSLENITVNMYDYIPSQTIIGSTISNYFYITIMKDNNYLSYEEYI